jgi:hypothetical protein
MAKSEFDIIESIPRPHTCRWPIFLEKPIQFFPDLSCAQFRCSAQRNENNVHPRRHVVPIYPEVLFEPSLDPISSTSFPNFFARRDSQPCWTHRIHERSDMKVVGAVPGSFFNDPPILGGAIYPKLFWEPKALLVRPIDACVPLPFFC